MSVRHAILVMVVAVLCALATGCTIRASSPKQLLVLSPLSDASLPQATGAAAMPALVVGPINLPAYTARAQVLVLKNESEMQASASARWAEPVDESFSRVLVENLSRLLHTGRVAALGGVQAPESLQVAVEVTEFITTDAGQARLTAFWQVLGGGGRTVLAQDKMHYAAPISGEDYSARAAALSQALAALSRDIAGAVQRVIVPGE